MRFSPNVFLSSSSSSLGYYNIIFIIIIVVSYYYYYFVIVIAFLLSLRRPVVSSNIFARGLVLNLKVWQIHSFSTFPRKWTWLGATLRILPFPLSIETIWRPSEIAYTLSYLEMTIFNDVRTFLKKSLILNNDYN